MADQYVLEVRLASEELTPRKIRSHDIAILISSVEKMIAAAMTVNSPELNIEEKEVTIGVTGISVGSYHVQFDSQYMEQVKPAYEIITHALTTKDFDDLPISSVEALKEIQKVSRRYHTETQFGYRNGQFIPLASLDASTILEPKSKFIEGETTLYGYLYRVGGTNPPKAALELANGRKIDCNINKSRQLVIAKQLGKRLYSEVGVSGIAHWDVRDMSLIYFKIDEILEFEDKPITESIDNLGKVMGHHLDQIEDLDDFFGSLRDDDDSGEILIGSWDDNRGF